MLRLKKIFNHSYENNQMTDCKRAPKALDVIEDSK